MKVSYDASIYFRQAAGHPKGTRMAQMLIIKALSRHMGVEAARNTKQHRCDPNLTHLDHVNSVAGSQQLDW